MKFNLGAADHGPKTLFTCQHGERESSNCRYYAGAIHTCICCGIKWGTLNSEPKDKLCHFCHEGEPKTNIVRLNLGAGGWDVEGFISLDRQNGQEVYPLEYEDNSVDEIRASHILEHFSHTKTVDVLNDWIRVLKPGGILRVAVPNLKWIAEKYLAGEDHPYMGYLFGGHTNDNDHHGAIFDEEELTLWMERCGLVDIKPWVSEIKDCASLPVSLNLQGTKKAKVPITNPIQGDEDYSWLKDKAFNRYSQFGEDGIIEAVFEKIGTTNKHVIECGAGDPVQFSNSRKLIEEGWSAQLFEQDEAKGQKLFDEYKQNGKVHVFTERVSHSGDFDNLLYNACDGPDLLILDIDGQEYYVWNSLIKARPRVVLVEFDTVADPTFIPAIGGIGQAGKDAIITLGFGKGYSFIGQVGVNLLFVLNGLEQKLNTAAGSDRSKIGTEVRGCLSSSRLGFMDTIVSVMTALVPLGIQLEINTGVFWGQALTKVMEGHIDEDGLKYYLTLDFDTLFTQNDVLMLYKLMEEHPEADVLCSLQMRREGDTPLLTMMSRAGESLQTISSDELEADIMPINSAHFGLTMIRVSSLKKAKKPWFMAVPDDKGEYGPEHMDEDVYFWHNLKESGLKAYQANRVTIGHLQLMATWPGMDLTPKHQYIRQWYEEGKPKEAR